MNCSGHPKIWQTQKNSLIWKWYTFPLFPPTQSVLFSDEWLNPQSIGSTHPDFFLVTGAGNWQLLGASPEVPNLGWSIASANLLISPGTNWERVGQASKMGDLSDRINSPTEMDISHQKKIEIGMSLYHENLWAEPARSSSWISGSWWSNQRTCILWWL